RAYCATTCARATSAARWLGFSANLGPQRLQFWLRRRLIRSACGWRIPQRPGRSWYHRYSLLSPGCLEDTEEVLTQDSTNLLICIAPLFEATGNIGNVSEATNSLGIGPGWSWVIALIVAEIFVVILIFVGEIQSYSHMFWSHELVQIVHMIQ